MKTYHEPIEKNGVSLRFEYKMMPAQNFNGESSLPPLSTYHGQYVEKARTHYGFDEDLYVGYGNASSVFPYKMQDMYTRELKDREIRTVILENGLLRAEFFPDFGGKLASLTDKTTGKPLLYTNPVIRPCNLALRNAWMSGGVEFNISCVGHNAHTCSTLFTAVTEYNGTPVLRFYEYERIRRVVWQMDFFLPEKEKFLYVRIRITNPNDRTTPMYWWSNTAAPELEKGRVITDCDSAYTSLPDGINRIPVPHWADTDVSYPVNSRHSIDYFFKTDDTRQRFECQVDENGDGLLETSTSILKGRKLFVWGQGPGGDRWQKYLTCENGGRYVELQAGLARTQYEHLPMPPHCAWEWVECYGPIHGNAEKFHGTYDEAKEEARKYLAENIPAEHLEQVLADSKTMALSAADEVIIRGSGWGALENERREKADLEKITPYLDFGAPGEEQKFWMEILDGKTGEYDPTDVPGSYMLDPEWADLLKKTSEPGWYGWMQLGLTDLANGFHEKAEEELKQSMAICESPWACYGLYKCEELKGCPEKAADYLIRASALRPQDISIAKESLTILVKNRMWDRADTLYRSLTDSVRALDRIRLLRIKILVELGRIDEADRMLNSADRLEIADIREGENMVTDLWFEIERRKAEREGRSFDEAHAVPPKHLDFRMAAE